MDDPRKHIMDAAGNPVTPQMQALITNALDMQDAQEIANAAPAVEIKDDKGKTVRSLKVKLTLSEAKRVMSMAPEMRATMAESILRERSLARMGKIAKTEAERAYTRKRQTERKRKNKNKKRNR